MSNVLNWSLFIFVIAVGVLSSISDIKYGKIYNKMVLLAFIIGLPLIVINYLVFSKDISIIYIINLLISAIIGFLFYNLRIWAAGDGKLWILIVYLMPLSMYMTSDNNLFPSLAFLTYSFSTAFIYLCIETLILAIKKKDKIIKKPKLAWPKLSSVISFWDGYFLILLLNILVSTFFSEFISNNQPLIIITCFFITIYINKISLSTRIKIILCPILLVVTSVYLMLNKLSVLTLFNWKYLLIIFAAVILRNWASTYNYESINIEDLKAGMVLSLSSVLKFRTSRVQGLPDFTDETTKCRLSVTQVDSIKRWKSSKHGEPTTIIVRQVPFGSFLFIGTIIYLALRWWLY